MSGLPSVPDPPETDANGRTTVSEFGTNDASAGDNFTLYAAAGDDVDRLRVEVVAPGAPTRLYPDSVSDTEGTISGFENMQNENGNFALLDGSPPNAFEIETTTNSVPSGNYALELGLGEVNLQGSSSGIDVTVEDASGTELGSTVIDERDSNNVVTVTLSNINSQQDITVRYQGDSQNDELNIDYQRLVQQ